MCAQSIKRQLISRSIVFFLNSIINKNMVNCHKPEQIIAQDDRLLKLPYTTEKIPSLMLRTFNFHYSAVPPPGHEFDSICDIESELTSNVDCRVWITPFRSVTPEHKSPFLSMSSHAALAASVLGYSLQESIVHRLRKPALEVHFTQNTAKS